MGDAVSDDLCRRAIEMAERVGAPEAQAEASITLALRAPGVHGRFDDSIRMLEEMISFCETHRLWYSAARAHTNLGAFLAGYDLDYHSGYHHHLQGATLFREIGDVDGMFFCLENLRDVSINLGNLSSLETTLAEFLYESTASEARIRPFLEDTSKELYFYRGELTYALEDARARLAESRSRNEIQNIAIHNTLLALIQIEQHRLSGSGDLSEAEAAVLENFELWDRTLVYQTQLATIYSLQGRFAEAHVLLADVYKAPPILRIGAKTIHAMAEGRWNQAASAVCSLIKLFPPIGARWDWARWLIDLGDIYAQRNQPGDLRRARETYLQALEMFTEMGAPGYIQVLEERLRDV